MPPSMLCLQWCQVKKTFKRSRLESCGSACSTPGYRVFDCSRKTKSEGGTESFRNWSNHTRVTWILPPFVGYLPLDRFYTFEITLRSSIDRISIGPRERSSDRLLLANAPLCITIRVYLFPFFFLSATSWLCLFLHHLCVPSICRRVVVRGYIHLATTWHDETLPVRIVSTTIDNHAQRPRFRFRSSTLFRVKVSLRCLGSTWKDFHLE